MIVHGRSYSEANGDLVLGRLQEDSALFIWYRSKRVSVSTWFLGNPVGGADRDRSTRIGVSGRTVIAI